MSPRKVHIGSKGVATEEARWVQLSDAQKTDTGLQT